MSEPNSAVSTVKCMDELSIDFETRSSVNITKEGAYRYARHWDTHIYMMSWAFGDEPASNWRPGMQFPQRIIDHVKNGGIIVAWNAQFERLIWWYILSPDFDIPAPALEQFHCTAARARAHGLPGALGDCARAMQLPIQKQEHGTRLIREYCAPNIPWEDIPPEDQALMIDYCDTDVDTERAVARCLRQLTDAEWAEYHLNERINDKGVPVDVTMAEAALSYAEEIREEVDARITQLTNGKVDNARRRTARDEWILPQLNQEQIDLITNKSKGKISFDENHRQALSVHPDLPEPVAQYLELLEEAGGSTTRKYDGIQQREIDGVVNGALLWNGAGQTGRFSSRGLQLHNLRRECFEDPDHVIKDLKDGYEMKGYVLNTRTIQKCIVERKQPPEPKIVTGVTETLAYLIRAAIYDPDGLSWFDFSSIESRVEPWLANSRLSELKLDVFRNGEDPYLINAERTFLIPQDRITKDQRQAGKVQELSLGFGGGVGALKAMARNYGIHLDTPTAEKWRDDWRAGNPWMMIFGDQLNRAALRAVIRPGVWFEAGRVAYAYDGADWLWCRLPSGRVLAYFQPRIEEVETPWGDTVDAVTTVWGAAKPKVGESWPRRAMYGGLWIENCTQAVAADLLREAIMRADKAGFDIRLHVHDEIVARGEDYKGLGEVMLQAPEWAAGLPLAGDGDCGTRYGK